VSGGSAPARSAPARWLWFAAGWVAVGLGSLGIVVPGLPTTVFFILAAAAFARSSPRFEQWILDLPRVGPMVRDHRAGLGMSRRAKTWAVATMVVVASLSVALSIEVPAVAVAVAALVVVGAWYVIWRVPTREVVLARRAGAPHDRDARPPP
jgi:uncharacterized protein